MLADAEVQDPAVRRLAVPERRGRRDDRAGREERAAALDRGVVALREVGAAADELGQGRRDGLDDLAAGLALFVGSIASTKLLPSGFIPPEDIARTLLAVELPPGSTLDDIARAFPGKRAAERFEIARQMYRNLGDGIKDPRTFYAYTYGFALNPAKTVKSVTLPSNDFVKIVGITSRRLQLPCTRRGGGRRPFARTISGTRISSS